MPPLNILVVGASIAGPTAAHWLARTGAKITVIERFPHFRTSGQNVDIRTTGVTVMQRMQGMEAAVRAKTTQVDGLAFVRDDGRPYGVIRSSGKPNRQTILSEYEIFRGDLSGILYDMTKDDSNIDYVFGEQISSIRHREDVVEVEFQNGRLSEEYDLVVACDGATSRTRAMGLECGAQEHVHPINFWAAYYTVCWDMLDGSKIGHALSAEGGRFISIKPDPAGVSKVTLIGIYPRNDAGALVPFRHAMSQGNTSLKQYIAERFAGMGWKTDEALHGMMMSDDFYANEIVQLKPPTLYNNRVVLVGDAGYASGPTGGGTSLALTGAYVLAGEIGKHQGDMAAGLQAYEKRMRPIIDDLQKIPPLVPGVMAPQTSWGIWLRNVMFAFIAWSGALEFLSRFFASSFDEAKHPLPDYKWER